MESHLLNDLAVPLLSSLSRGTEGVSNLAPGDPSRPSCNDGVNDLTLSITKRLPISDGPCWRMSGGLSSGVDPQSYDEPGGAMNGTSRLMTEATSGSQEEVGRASCLHAVQRRA